MNDNQRGTMYYREEISPNDDYDRQLVRSLPD
jgi:hypothetical protein